MIRLREILAFIFLTTVLFGSVAAGQTGSGSSKNPATPPGSGSTVAVPSGLKPCDPAGMTPLRLSQPGTGHHKVALSWEASVPTPDHPGKTVGYCLYRTQKQGAANRDPTCKDCEQVNGLPFPGISCVDDIVEDGVTYYYVAFAMSADGKRSLASNEARVLIPPANQTKSVSTNPPPIPLCRGVSGKK